MADSKFWHDLAGEFSSIPEDNTYAELMFNLDFKNSPELTPLWVLHSNTAHVEAQFEAIARRGGYELGNDPDSLQAWIEALNSSGVAAETKKLHRRLPGEHLSDVVMELRVRLNSLPKISALFCREREISELKREHAPFSGTRSNAVRQQAPEPIPIGVEIEALRIEAEITQERLAELVGVDIRNVQKHIAGTASPSKLTLNSYPKIFLQIIESSGAYQQNAVKRRIPPRNSP